MRTNFKSSISSRASVRSLIIACMPAGVIAFAANSPALGAAFDTATNHDVAVDDNTGTGTNGPAANGPSTNSSGNSTNHDIIYCCAGIRR